MTNVPWLVTTSTTGSAMRQTLHARERPGSGSARPTLADGRRPVGPPHSDQMSWSELLFGHPLRSDEETKERVGSIRGVGVLGLDALASAAYGPEAALT